MKIQIVDQLVRAAMLSIALQRADAVEAPAPSLMTFDLTEVDKYTRSVRVVASTANPVGGKAITSWDLSRFLKNPVVLWGHNKTTSSRETYPIGVAREVEWDDDEKVLKMRIFFASERANPFAEQVWAGVQEGLIRAVSVGYDDLGGGSAKLAELSVVPVGLDEDAGTPALNPEAAEGEDEPSDEEMTRRASVAASALAKQLHRKRALLRAAASTEQRADSLGEGEVLRMDRQPLRLDSMEDTPAGGKKIPARLARVGVLRYADPSYPDGFRRELVTEEEAFNADSLATLEGAPVIDITHHTGMVTPETWRERSLGHTHAVRQDGVFVRGELHVNDRATLDDVEGGARTEISCGYKCRLDMTPGEWQGQRYDCVQRGRRYNHVALCPPNRGRAGPEVGLRLDQNAPPWCVSHYDEEDKEISMGLKIRLDNRDMEIATQDHLDTVLATIEKTNAAIVAAEKAKATAEATARADLQTKLDSTQGKLDATLSSFETFKTDAAKAKEAKEEEDKKEAAERAKRSSFRRKLERAAFRYFADDEDEEKMDAFFSTATDREIMERVIKKTEEKFDAKDRSDAYVQARFDMLVEQAGAAGPNPLSNIVRKAETLRSTFDSNEDPVEKARRQRDEDSRKIGQAPTPPAFR